LINIILTYTFYFVLFSGIGLLIYFFQFGFWNNKLLKMFLPFWIGWSTCILILQIWHLFAPITSVLLILLGILSISGWMLSSRDIIKELKSTSKIRIMLSGVIMLAVGLWLGSLATESTVPYDTGLYHLQAIKWNSEYAIVPGLGNLHSRLAFNNSNFLYSALIDQGFWDGRSHHIANSILVFVAILQIADRVVDSIIQKRKSFVSFYYLVVAGSVVGWIYGFPVKYALTSHNQDLPVFILGVLCFGMLLRNLLESESAEQKVDDYFQLFFLCACGVTIKLSFLPIAALICIFILSRMWWEKVVHLKEIIKLSILPGIMLLTWLFRGVVLSGYLFYPNPVLSVPVAWRIPYEQVERTQKGITSWAKFGSEKGSAGSEETFAMVFSHLDIGTRVMIQAGIFSALSAFLLAVINKRKLHLKIFQWMALIGICIVIWFFAAPHARFSPGLFPAFLAGGVMLFYDQVSGNKLRPLGIVFMLAAIAFTFTIAFHLKNQAVNPILRIELGPALKRMSANPDTYTGYLVDGVEVYYPLSSDQCWNTPLPCAPQPRSRLHLIKPPDVQSGFWFSE